MLRTKRQKRQALFSAKETIRHKQIDLITDATVVNMLLGLYHLTNPKETKVFKRMKDTRRENSRNNSRATTKFSEERIDYV